MNEKLYIQLLKKLEDGWQGLGDKPAETPQNTLRTLWKYVSGGAGDHLPDLDHDALERLNSLIDQKLSGIPLAYLVGRQSFMGLEFISSPQAMIPRQETELLAQTALSKQKNATDLKAGQSYAMLDLCTGSGNIPLIFAKRSYSYQCFGSDLSEQAVDLARRNAKHLSLPQVEFRVGDLFEAFDSQEFYDRFDLITCNPPYISSAQVEKMPEEIRAYEPRLAFDGGSFGVSILLRLIKEAPKFLKADAWLCFEVGLGQGDLMRKKLQMLKKYDCIETIQDEQGDIRALAAHYLQQ